MSAPTEICYTPSEERIIDDWHNPTIAQCGPPEKTVTTPEPGEKESKRRPTRLVLSSVHLLLILVGSLAVTRCGAGGNKVQSSGSTGGSGSGTGGGNPTSASVNVTGKWEFADGMNVNLTQQDLAVNGDIVYQTIFNQPPNPPGALLLESCGTVSGTVSAMTVSLHSGVCGGGIVPSGGYSTTTTANASVTSLVGGQWGDAFAVQSLSGTYSGDLTFYSSLGSVGTSATSLTLTEDSSHNLVGNLQIVNGKHLDLAGQAIGGTISLGANQIVGVVQSVGGIQVTVSGTSLYCGVACATVGIGVLH